MHFEITPTRKNLCVLLNIQERKIAESLQRGTKILFTTTMFTQFDELASKDFTHCQNDTFWMRLKDEGFGHFSAVGLEILDLKELFVNHLK